MLHLLISIVAFTEGIKTSLRRECFLLEKSILEVMLRSIYTSLWEWDLGNSMCYLYWVAVNIKENFTSSFIKIFSPNVDVPLVSSICADAITSFRDVTLKTYGSDRYSKEVIDSRKTIQKLAGCVNLTEWHMSHSRTPLPLPHMLPPLPRSPPPPCGQNETGVKT